MRVLCALVYCIFVLPCASVVPFPFHGNASIRYIIALGVMDCSVMMSLKLAPAPATTGDGEGAAQSSSFQGKRVAGLFQTPDGRRVAYCVSVVDAGPKPPTKLSGKAKHEDEIWDFVAGLEDAGEVI